VATWDDSETEYDEEVDTTNVCFMANGDNPTMVSQETSLDNDELMSLVKFLKICKKYMSFQKFKTRN